MADEPKTDPSKSETPPEKEKPTEDGKTKSRIEDLVAQRETERLRADAAETKLKDIEAAQQKAQDEEAKKKGDFEKLLSQREKELEKLKGENELTKKEKEAYEATLKTQLDKSLESVKDEKKRATIQKALDGRPLADQVGLLPDLMEAIGATSPSGFGGATPSSNTPSPTELDREEFRKLYDKSRTSKLTPEEDRKFFQLSKKLGDQHNKNEEKTRKDNIEKQMRSESENYFS